VKRCVCELCRGSPVPMGRIGGAARWRGSSSITEAVRDPIGRWKAFSDFVEGSGESKSWTRKVTTAGPPKGIVSRARSRSSGGKKAERE